MKSTTLTRKELEILGRKSRAKDRRPRNALIARIAHRLGYIPRPTFRGRGADPGAWNKTIDWLDRNHPLWRGYPVEYVQSDREVA